MGGKMKKILNVLLIIILFNLLLVACESKQSPLVGKWELIEDFGFWKAGENIEFFKDGTVDWFGFASEFEDKGGKVRVKDYFFNYTIESDTLTFDWDSGMIFKKVDDTNVSEDEKDSNQDEKVKNNQSESEVHTSEESTLLEKRKVVQEFLESETSTEEFKNYVESNNKSGNAVLKHFILDFKRNNEIEVVGISIIFDSPNKETMDMIKNDNGKLRKILENIEEVDPNMPYDTIIIAKLYEYINDNQIRMITAFLYDK